MRFYKGFEIFTSTSGFNRGTSSTPEKTTGYLLRVDWTKGDMNTKLPEGMVMFHHTVKEAKKEIDKFTG